nr:TadE/TadG family type IV pilus assembly protein [uncultured Sphingomonas sp.]
MIKLNRMLRDQQGATVIEFAFALPVLIVMVFMIYQMGLLFRANSGIQHSLGQGARAATLWPTPTEANVRTIMLNAVYGIGPGTFATPQIEKGTADGSTYWDLSVTYSQQTSLIMFPGPTVSMTRKKRVWVAS